MQKLAEPRVDPIDFLAVAPHLDRGEEVTAAPPTDERTRVRTVVFIAAVMFAAGLVGIWSRPAGFMASFWPANPLILALMLSHKRFRHPVCFAAAFVGLVGADLITGSSMDITIGMNLTNIVGTIVGVVAARWVLTAKDLSLSTPESVLRLFVLGVISCLGTAFVGMFVSNYLFDDPWDIALRGWFAGELGNFLAIVPVVLTAPRRPWFAGRTRTPLRRARDWEQVWQYALIPVTLGIALLVGGPGAMVFPLPALLWCAVRTNVFQTAVLSLLSTASLNIFVAMEWLTLADRDSLSSTKSSVQLGLSFLVIGPLVVASTTEARRAMLAELKRRATRDALTGVLTRRAFFDDADLLLDHLESRGRSAAVMMLDLDHFKAINDNLGHPAGDKVLETFAEVVAACLRRGDVLGRIGGEEFAIVLPNIGEDDAKSVAERIRTAVRSAVVVYNEQPIAMSVSIGIVATDATSMGLATLMSRADEALYAAKTAGRNQVAVAPLNIVPTIPDL